MAEVLGTFNRLDVWGEQVKTPLSPPAGSALAQDDAIFPWLATADVAWQGLCSAQDHLKGFRAWIRSDRPELFPIATFSLLRGALVGGATAAWVTYPDDVELRVGRSLAVAAEWYRNHLNYGRTVAPIAVDKVAHTSQLNHVERRAAEVQALRAARPKTAFKMTDVIQTANAELWSSDATRALQTKALWQAGSGDAHALGWSILSRSYQMTSLGNGKGAFVGNPSDRDVADAYLCAYDFVAYGFHRLQELSQVT
jgi:hypothetical protein